MSEIKTITDLKWYSEQGLGYGIDVTTDHPWKNKGPLIVQPVESLDDIKTITASCALEQYHRDIVSSKDISLSVSANLSTIDTTLIKMGVDAEASRSKTYALHAVGSKIHTRTIDFVPDLGSKLTFFEETLRKYVEYDDLFITEEVLKNKCKEFVAKYRCTHYVRAIMFGALDYEVLTHEEYTVIHSATGEIGVQELGATPAAGAGIRKKVQRKRGHAKRLQIGRWNEDNEVVKERVIEVEITPIESLVKTPKLIEALISALKEYRREKLQKRPIGPFLIKCREQDNPLYLKEGSKGRVIITERKEEATKFSLSQNKIKHPTLFSICVFSEGGPTRCLSCDHFFGGRSPPNNPPVLTKTFRDDTIQMSLKDQLLEKGNRIDPQKWIDEGKWYVIRCSHRHRLKQGSKLCVKETASGCLELGAVPSIECQGDESFMQFGLEVVPAESIGEYPYKHAAVADF